MALHEEYTIIETILYENGEISASSYILNAKFGDMFNVRATIPGNHTSKTEDEKIALVLDYVYKKRYLEKATSDMVDELIKIKELQTELKSLIDDWSTKTQLIKDNIKVLEESDKTIYTEMDKKIGELKAELESKLELLKPGE